MPKSTFKWVVGATVSAVLLTGCGFYKSEKKRNKLIRQNKLRTRKVERKYQKR